jgi:hypothetical protein
MKDSSTEDIHEKLIKSWEEKNVSGLNFEQHLQLLEKAFLAVEKRAFTTLSSVTLSVVTDRVLHHGRQKYPALNDIKFENRIIDFKLFNENLKKHPPEELIQALRFILAEQLRVLGRITADILTEPLHQTLLEVTWEDRSKT